MIFQAPNVINQSIIPIMSLRVKQVGRIEQNEDHQHISDINF